MMAARNDVIIVPWSVILTPKKYFDQKKKTDFLCNPQSTESN